jgi:hypothetical protein
MKNDAIQTRSRTAARTVKAVGNLNFRAGSSGGRGGSALGGGGAAAPLQILGAPSSSPEPSDMP